MDDKEELTNDKIRIEVVCNWHDNVLKGIQIIGITHSFRGPGDVYVSSIGLATFWKKS